MMRMHYIDIRLVMLMSLSFITNGAAMFMSIKELSELPQAVAGLSRSVSNRVTFPDFFLCMHDFLCSMNASSGATDGLNTHV